MDINAAVSSLSAAHPFYAFFAGAVLGPLWPKAVTWLISDGVDLVVPKVLAFQKFYLSKAGVTGAQLQAVETKEADALARAAADVTKDAGAATSPPQP